MSWSHVNLRSAQGTDIRLAFEKQQKSFSSNKPTSAVIADNVWANVQREGLGPDNKVRLVLVNKDVFDGNSNAPGVHTEREYVQIVDLAYAEPGRFTAPLEDVTLRGNSYSGPSVATQRVAVVVDGQWQSDAIRPNVNEFNTDMFLA